MGDKQKILLPSRDCCWYDYSNVKENMLEFFGCSIEAFLDMIERLKLINTCVAYMKVVDRGTDGPYVALVVVRLAPPNRSKQYAKKISMSDIHSAWREIGDFECPAIAFVSPELVPEQHSPNIMVVCSASDPRPPTTADYVEVRDALSPFIVLVRIICREYEERMLYAADYYLDMCDKLPAGITQDACIKALKGVLIATTVQARFDQLFVGSYYVWSWYDKMDADPPDSDDFWNLALIVKGIDQQNKIIEKWLQQKNNDVSEVRDALKKVHHDVCTNMRSVTSKLISSIEEQLAELIKD